MDYLDAGFESDGVDTDRSYDAGRVGRPGDRVPRSIASTILGGALFAVIGWTLARELDAGRALGEALMLGGAGAWGFGCVWFAWHCRARRGWIPALLGAHLFGLLGILGLLSLGSQAGQPANAQWITDAARSLGYSGSDEALLRWIPRLTKFGCVLAFAFVAQRLSRFCRAVQPEPG